MVEKIRLASFSLVVLCACSSAESQESAQVKPVVSNELAAPVKSGGQTVIGDRITGKVVETMDSAGYTYAAVEVSKGKVVWAAARQTPIKIGDVVDVQKGTQMTNFTSRTLQRNFDAIYFVASFGPQVAAPSPTAPTPSPTSAPDSAPTSNPTKSSASAPQNRSVKGVPKADGGMTIEEIFNQASKLAGKQVRVRGRVVKFNGGIMGKNWFHLQDGTGDAATKTHDLTVTSDAQVAVGSTVLIKGLLTKDKDLGSGYLYPVIIENAIIEGQ